MTPRCASRPSDADTAEPLLLHFKRSPSSSTMNCYRTRASPLPRLNDQAVHFLQIRQVGASNVFSYADTKESWAKITHSAELDANVLDAPSLGLLQIPLSTYLDDMTPLFPGSGGAFSMRTRYGCQKWFRELGKDDSSVTVKASYPTQSEDQAESLVSALTLVAQEVSNPSNLFQEPHFLPSHADPNLFAKWPFSFNITAVYRSRDDFTLKVTLADLPSSPLLVREATVDLIHAAVLAAFTINESIWGHQELQ